MLLVYVLLTPSSLPTPGAILDQIQLEVGQTKLALRKAKEAAAKK